MKKKQIDEIMTRIENILDFHFVYPLFEYRESVMREDVVPQLAEAIKAIREGVVEPMLKEKT